MGAVRAVQRQRVHLELRDAAAGEGHRGQRATGADGQVRAAEAVDCRRLRRDGAAGVQLQHHGPRGDADGPHGLHPRHRRPPDAAAGTDSVRRPANPDVGLGPQLGVHPGIRGPRPLRDDGEVQPQGHQHLRHRVAGPLGEGMGPLLQRAQLLSGGPRRRRELRRLLRRW